MQTVDQYNQDFMKNNPQYSYNTSSTATSTPILLTKAIADLESDLL